MSQQCGVNIIQNVPKYYLTLHLQYVLTYYELNSFLDQTYEVGWVSSSDRSVSDAL